MSITLSTSHDHSATTQTASTTPPPNNFLDNMIEAIETYPQTYLTLEIYDVDPPGTGTAINEGEDVTFRVHVHNSGPLDVTDLTLLIEGLPATDGVRLHTDTGFSSSLTSAPIELVPAHQRAGDFIDPTDGHFHFKAGCASGGRADLIRVVPRPATSVPDPATSVPADLADRAERRRPRRHPRGSST